MKKAKILTGLACALLVSCQSVEPEIHMPGEVDISDVVEAITVHQITRDVNSVEVDNILARLFDTGKKSRSADYTVSVLKDKAGEDRMICINYADNKGFALISADKTHQPVLAYAEEGNFTDTDNLPFPLNEWFTGAMEDIAESKSLPADSLQKIAAEWRCYEAATVPSLKRTDRSRFQNLTWDEYMELSRIMMDQINIWNSQGYRVYALNDYQGTISLGDKNGIGSYVYNHIYPYYMEDYADLTIVIEKEWGAKYGTGHCFKTQWDQYSGFNQSFDATTDNPTGHIPVGCGPVAVGQVMYYFQYPQFFNWGAMVTGNVGNKVTSDFLLDVYHKCNAKYTKDKNGNMGTGCTEEERVKALKSYGYSCQTVSKVDDSILLYYSPAIIKSSLVNAKGQESSHAWVVEGAILRESYIETQVWTFNYERAFSCIHKEDTLISSSTLSFANWGWGGKYDAYYGLKLMKPEIYSGNKIESAIINIKPNR